MLCLIYSRFMFISWLLWLFVSIFFLLDDSPASELYVPTFRDTLFHLHR